MKLRSTFKVKIVDSIDNSEAFVTYRKIKANAQLKAEVEAKEVDDQSKAESYVDLVLGQVVALEGFYDEDGDDITVEQLKDIKDSEFIMPIVLGYSRALQQMGSIESAEKKFGGIV